MDQYDLPPLRPFEYGAAGALKAEVLKALRYASTHEGSRDAISTYLSAAAVLAEGTSGAAAFSVTGDFDPTTVTVE